MKNRSPFPRLVAVAVSLSVGLELASGDGFRLFGKGGNAGEPRLDEPAEPSPVISPIPPGDPEMSKESGGGGWLGRLRERQKAAAAAALVPPIPMQQGMIGEATGSDRKSTASESKPKPRPAPAEPPKPPVKSRSTVKTPSSGPIGETFAWEAAPPPSASPAKGTAEKKPAIDLDRPRLVMRKASVGHFVALRDGIWEGGLKPRTVLRLLDRYTGDVIRARTAAGAEILLKTWQVRDATFDEAVNFMQSEGF